ncbi:YciI family protein [Cellulomonas sp. NPDC057328]|uniref:YciI family protein n=1 Tax=Cellulomonas sp. NPDC057328 TaxID=3346101 RepID=UPI00362E1603
MARYLILIHGDEQQWDARTPEHQEANDAGHRAFAAAAGDRVLGGEELAAAATTTTLRGAPDGGVLVTDGPFLETKEVLGGYYLVEARDLDEALALARHLPELREPHAAVEVRPVVDHG